MFGSLVICILITSCCRIFHWTLNSTIKTSWIWDIIQFTTTVRFFLPLCICPLNSVNVRPTSPPQQKIKNNLLADSQTNARAWKDLMLGRDNQPPTSSRNRGPRRKRNPCLWRCHLALRAAAADTQTAGGARIVLQKMSARHIGSRRDTNRFPKRKRREPKWRRASFAKPLLINRVSGENYMIWFLLLHHSAAANDIQGSSSTRHTSSRCCVWQ